MVIVKYIGAPPEGSPFKKGNNITDICNSFKHICSLDGWYYKCCQYFQQSIPEGIEGYLVYFYDIYGIIFNLNAYTTSIFLTKISSILTDSQLVTNILDHCSCLQIVNYIPLTLTYLIKRFPPKALDPIDKKQKNINLILIGKSENIPKDRNNLSYNSIFENFETRIPDGAIDRFKFDFKKTGGHKKYKKNMSKKYLLTQQSSENNTLKKLKFKTQNQVRNYKERLIKMDGKKSIKKNLKVKTKSKSVKKH